MLILILFQPNFKPVLLIYELDAVAAVQLENRKLKDELALLSRRKEKMDREFKENGTTKDMEKRQTDATKERKCGREKDKEKEKEKDKEKEKEKEKNLDEKNRSKFDEKENVLTNDKLFVSPPTSPVSFVSRAICQIEGKSPTTIDNRSVSIML